MCAREFQRGGMSVHVLPLLKYIHPDFGSWVYFFGSWVYIQQLQCPALHRVNNNLCPIPSILGTGDQKAHGAFPIIYAQATVGLILQNQVSHCLHTIPYYILSPKTSHWGKQSPSLIFQSMIRTTHQYCSPGSCLSPPSQDRRSAFIEAEFKI